MSSDDDSQLKDLVSQTLESKGILSKLRAELRANVFLALEGNEKFKEQLRKNSKIIDLLSTDEGVLALCIVQEFLEFCELKYTHTVLESEIGVPSDQIKTRGRQQLISDLKLNSENSKTPVLCQLLGVNQQTSAHQSSNSNNKQISLESHDSADSKPSHGENKLLNGENETNRLKQKTRAPEDQLILDLNLTNMNGSQEDEHSTNYSPLLLDLPPLLKPSPNLIPNSKLLDTINSLETNDQGEQKINNLKTNNQANSNDVQKEVVAEEKARSPSHKKGDGDTGSVSEIEEDLDSADDLLNSSGSLRDDVTQDNSISTLSSGICDYIEDVNKFR